MTKRVLVVRWIRHDSRRESLLKRPCNHCHSHMSVVPWGTFKTRNGYIVLARPNDSMGQAFCAAVGRPELAKNARFDVNGKRKAQKVTVGKRPR